MPWQPIDTAPEDVPVLVRGPAGVSLAERWRGEWFVSSEGDYISQFNWGEGELAKPTNPTEWHPIPD